MEIKQITSKQVETELFRCPHKTHFLTGENLNLHQKEKMYPFLFNSSVLVPPKLHKKSQNINLLYILIYCSKEIRMIIILFVVIILLIVFFFCFLLFQDAFSLIAYSNPWASPLGWQLCPSKREAVCRALNSAILGKV